ncbi:uncharacterized protein L201_005213 [Kwoniella dendrophila CBS 6074]|uniref:N-acetyltransferase domain-containing protein n=1 Tax=Kwoniella dendrophila CBS 6074 TaxID=1295534 RepID=A0AAX4JY18_9TREE
MGSDSDITCPIKVPDDGQPYIPLPNHPELRLTTWKENDIDGIIELFNLPNIGKWGHGRPYPFTREDALKDFPNIELHQKYLKILIKDLPNSSPNKLIDYPSSKLGPLSALKVKENKNGSEKLIGTLNLKQSTRSTNGKDWELSYYVHDNYTKQGIATDMVQKGLEFLRWLGVEKIIAFSETTNQASISVLKKSGFKIVKEGLVDWPEHRGGGTRSHYRWEQDLTQ